MFRLSPAYEPGSDPALQGTATGYVRSGPCAGPLSATPPGGDVVDRRPGGAALSGIGRRIAPLAAVLALAACDREAPQTEPRWTDEAAPANTPVAMRWYTREQIQAGADLYRTHCATCHKENAEGTKEWKQRDAEGKLPPPPLNGTAHTWHHPLSVLRTVVRRGGAPVGGTMPAFGDKLSSEQIDAILAWVQSRWPEEIYALWSERDTASRRRP